MDEYKMEVGKASPIGTIVVGDDGTKWKVVDHLVLSPEVNGVAQSMAKASYCAFLGGGDFRNPDKEYWGICPDGEEMLSFIVVQWGAVPERVVRGVLTETIDVVLAMYPEDNDVQRLALDALSVLDGGSPSSTTPWDDVTPYLELLRGMAPLGKLNEVPPTEPMAKAHMMLALTTILSPFWSPDGSVRYVWDAIIKAPPLLSPKGGGVERRVQLADIIRKFIVDPPGAEKEPELMDWPELVEEDE